MECNWPLRLHPARNACREEQFIDKEASTGKSRSRSCRIRHVRLGESEVSLELGKDVEVPFEAGCFSHCLLWSYHSGLKAAKNGPYLGFGDIQ